MVALARVNLADVLNLKSDYPAAEPLYKAAMDVLPKQSLENIAAGASLGEMFVHLGR